MKRTRPWRVIVVALILAGLAGARLSDAGDAASSRTYTAGDKLVRGLANVCLGFIEIPRNIHNTTEEESLLAGWTVGVGKGLGYTVMRMAVGVYEVVTFPFPLPKDYVPVLEPAFVWQAPGPKYK
jgi:putative exosortase-associated protein (TIGR04073 family)